ncbi:MAG: aldo/keto reductase [Metallosphaera sp.]|uniref:aldo/keto reductase n=1 Tax=Metallosphaera sp. TaxID=2020860 RepID=UPI003164506F
MLFRDFGRTGINVSQLGIGMWSLVTDWWGRPDKARDIIKAAIDLDINFFDTADMYGNGKAEEILGDSVKTKRDKVIILTKIGYDFYTSPERPKQRYDIEYLNMAVKKSLKRLQTDYIDILMLHNPKLKDISNKDLLEFMKSLKSDGIARVIGVALGPTLGWENEGLKAIEVGYESLEHIFNIIELYPGMRLLKHNIGHVVRVPHASDVLNDSKWPLRYDPKLHRRFKTQVWIDKAVERTLDLRNFALSRGLKLNELALAFVWSFENVSTVVPNITTIEELRESEKSTRVILNEDDVEYIIQYYEKNYKELNEESIKETEIYK